LKGKRSLLLLLIYNSLLGMVKRASSKMPIRKLCAGTLKRRKNISRIKDAGYLLVRPLIDFLRTPLYFYRVGIVLSALEAGYHDRSISAQALAGSAQSISTWKPCNFSGCFANRSETWQEAYPKCEPIGKFTTPPRSLPMTASRFLFQMKALIGLSLTTHFITCPIQILFSGRCTGF